MSCKLNVNICQYKVMSEQSRKQNAPEVKSPVPFLLEPFSPLPKALFVVHCSLDRVLVYPSFLFFKF